MTVTEFKKRIDGKKVRWSDQSDLLASIDGPRLTLVQPNGSPALIIMDLIDGDQPYREDNGRVSIIEWEVEETKPSQFLLTHYCDGILLHTEQLILEE